MPILIHPEKKTVHITDQKRLSLVLDIRDCPPHGPQLMLRYFGAPLALDANLDFLSADDAAPASFDSISQGTPYAYPVRGTGDYRITALEVQGADGVSCGVLNVQDFEARAGKPALAGLPQVYIESEREAETLVVHLQDPVTALTAALHFTLHSELGVITESIRFENQGDQMITLTDPASCAMTLRGTYDLLHLHGAWARERQVERTPGMHGIREISSIRGASGHQHNPFAVLCAPDATEQQGDCYGFLMLYSGSFRMQAEESEHGTTRFVAGIHPCAWRLAPGESFQTPEAALAFSPDGLNGVSQLFHQMIRTRVCRGYWRDRERPVLVNNWEGTYFDFNTEKLLDIARRASALGVELFVLDDGWFGKRNQDNCSLGDWVVNEEKLPGGLPYLASEINALGMRFGLWFEPEMVSPDSALYRAHPDWCLHAPSRGRSERRNQLILDLSRTDVQDYIIRAVSDVLHSAPIDYVKWDMNRNFTESGSALLSPAQQGEAHHRYMLGLYRVLEEVTARFPQVLFESCSGGGGRFDAGMLYYMPQTWTSDDSDALERLFIQYGTSMAYPPCAMGAHVTAVPNHQLGRVTSLQMRGAVALSGNFGYELDLSKQLPQDLEEMKRQVAFVKQVRHLTQKGRFTRLLSPFEGSLAAWQFADETREELLICLFRRYARGNAPREYVKIRDVDESRWYRDEQGNRYQGSVLRHVGIPAHFDKSTDAASIVMHLRAE